jgi:hypothetical protein
MTQFDVFANPIANALTVYPYVVVLQSRVASTRGEVVVTGSLTTLPSADLKRKIANLSSNRSELLGAIDLLFVGV